MFKWKRLFQRRSNYETAVGPRLVSRPKSAPSVDDIPSDSLCAVAGALAAFPCRAGSWRDVWCTPVHTDTITAQFTNITTAFHYPQKKFLPTNHSLIHLHPPLH